MRLPMDGVTNPMPKRKNDTPDLELDAAVKEAIKLRIKLTEICEYTGVDKVQLWRWRNRYSPRYNERQEFLAKLERMMDERRAHGHPDES